MKKAEAINKLIEIRKIARNYEHNSGKRLSDILKVLDSIPSSVLVCKPIAQKSSPMLDLLKEPRRRFEKNIEARYQIDPSRKGRRDRRPMRVGVNGITYESIDVAADALGILPATVCKRCGDPSEKFKGWTFIYTP